MHYYLTRPQRDGVDADEWKPESDTKAKANIEEWYRAGRLLFPRETLVSIRDQLRKPPSKGDLVYVKALDELTYEYVVQTGEMKMPLGFFGAPQIYYTSFDSLKRNTEHSLSRAYFPVGLAHLLLPADEQPDPQNVQDINAGVDAFNTAMREWEAGDAWREIKTTLLSLKLRVQINKIIGMASGPFAATSKFKHTEWERSRRRSAVQNAFIVSLKNALQESHLGGDNVQCYAQDPAYDAADLAVLQQSGVEVVEDPDGFLHLDNASLLFSCSPNICVKEIVADMARPPIIIWTDPDSPRVIEMIRAEYDKLAWPEDDGDNFTTMAIYVKKNARAP
ncbi:uncharacterized protein DSM5745_10357 [Aspergillus mulundensis]|uniref:SRR1-like domain-containing protein n=1 Tax=Aspergillus mulundensis TaxID=1810919 RepID=A0A3D8QN46_9EURO|nr:hypothetical protein DSM5745_10357 [Aspergillus mulundensis]RDW63246.1 hypothetical protein DSM5745_10357 [Aspergillus mulundensis]